MCVCVYIYPLTYIRLQKGSHPGKMGTKSSVKDDTRDICITIETYHQGLVLLFEELGRKISLLHIPIVLGLCFSKNARTQSNKQGK